MRQLVASSGISRREMGSVGWQEEEAKGEKETEKQKIYNLFKFEYMYYIVVKHCISHYGRKAG